MMTLHRERSLSEIQNNIVTGSTQKKGKLADGEIPLSAGGGRGTAWGEKGESREAGGDSVHTDTNESDGVGESLHNALPACQKDARDQHLTYPSPCPFRAQWLVLTFPFRVSAITFARSNSFLKR